MKPELKVTVLSKQESDALAGALEDKFPDFKELYDDPDICLCCKPEYDNWEWDKVVAWREYKKYRFIGG